MSLIFLAVSSSNAFFVTKIINVTLTVSGEPPDTEPPIVSNVRHIPLFPNSSQTISFYAEVTDNGAVSTVRLNYTLNGGAAWQLQNMTHVENITY